jgi:hypothetical protein
MRCARGQGTVEYLAVVLLAAVLLGGGTAAAASPAGGRIATAVPRQVLYGICIVTGGDCDRDRAPCDVGTRTASHGWSVTVVVLKGGHRRVLVREHRSDGTVVVTELKAPSGGLEVTTGTGARIRVGGRTLTLGGDATAAAVGALGRGRVWVLDGDAAADSLIAALEDGDAVPVPDQRFTQGELTIGGSVSAGDGERISGTGAVGATGAVGRRRDRVTGTQTLFLEAGVTGDLSVSLRQLKASAGATGSDRERYALTIDRDGRWRDLTVVRTGELSGTVSLPETLRPVADALNAPGAIGRRWVAETHLDLTDPANLAAARAFVTSIRAMPPRSRAALAAAQALSGRLDERGVVDVRTYALERATNGIDVHAGRGLGVGAGVQNTTEHTRLIAATTRGLDGQWRRRDDCLEEATA